jgi:hypothetical protein
MNNSYKAILDREYGSQSAQHFKDSVDVLNEVLNYGSQLLPKAIERSPRDVKAVCIIFVQLRQVLAHLDGIAVLVTAGNCFSAGLQIRSLLEIAHTMEWLFKSDTEAKVHYLYVANLRKRRRWQSIAISGTPEATLHADAASRLAISSEDLNSLKDEIRRIDILLASPEFSGIDLKFQNHYVKYHFDKQWYEVYGLPTVKLSIRKIADAIGKVKEYNYIYTSFSAVTHGGDIFKNVVFGNNISPNPIREPQDIPKLANAAMSFAFRVYRMILEQYIPAEIDEFNKKYVNEWRARYLKQYSVKITAQDTII